MKILSKSADCRPLPTYMFIISNEGFISPEIDLGGIKMQTPVSGGRELYVFVGG